jgi:hypothetical protein
MYVCVYALVGLTNSNSVCSNSLVKGRDFHTILGPQGHRC